MPLYLTFNFPSKTISQVPLLCLFAVFAMSVNAADLPFKTITVAKQDVEDRYVLDGKIQAVHQATVSSETSGRVTGISFDIGDHVEEGQILVRVTQAEQQASLSSSRALVREAEARLIQAQAEYQRVEGVYAKKLVAKSVLDKATADLKTADQKLISAKARLEAATEKLKYTTIRAPFSGVVVQRLVELGEAVTPGKPVMEGLSLKAMRVVTQVPQSLQSSLRSKPAVTIQFFQQDIADIEVTNLTLSPRANINNASFLMRGDLPENTPNVYPGMLVKLSFSVGNVQHLIIPKESVVRRSELTAVYVVDKLGLSLRQIRLGRELNGELVVLSGLSAGEIVALDPVRAGVHLKEIRQAR